MSALSVRTRFRLQRYKEFLRYTNIRKKFLKIIQRPMAYYQRQGLLLVLSGNRLAPLLYHRLQLTAADLAAATLGKMYL